MQVCHTQDVLIGQHHRTHAEVEKKSEPEEDDSVEGQLLVERIRFPMVLEKVAFLEEVGEQEGEKSDDVHNWQTARVHHEDKEGSELLGVYVV